MVIIYLNLFNLTESYSKFLLQLDNLINVSTIKPTLTNMKTFLHILGNYTGELIITTIGVVIRKIELTILRRKARKEKNRTV